MLRTLSAASAAHRAAPAAQYAVSAALPHAVPRRGMAGPTMRLKPLPPSIRRIPGVRQVIVVSSAKGGVGKSTVAVNLACALRRYYPRVGILDADIFGPSLPQMLRLPDKKPDVDENKNMIPHEVHGMQCNSMGVLVPKDSPMIWRGPMVMSAVEQLFFKTAWKDIDVLVVDMVPPSGPPLARRPRPHSRSPAAAGHRRHAADARPEGPRGRRRDRVDAAGRGAHRRGPRGAHVQESQRPDPGPGGEHEHVPLPELRARERDLRERRGAGEGGRARHRLPGAHPHLHRDPRARGRGAADRAGAARGPRGGRLPRRRPPRLRQAHRPRLHRRQPHPAPLDPRPARPRRPRPSSKLRNVFRLI